MFEQGTSDTGVTIPSFLLANTKTVLERYHIIQKIVSNLFAWTIHSWNRLFQRFSVFYTIVRWNDEYQCLYSITIK